MVFHTKPLHISFGKVDGFIRVYDGTKYFVLFELEKHDSIYNRIRSLISKKMVLLILFIIFMQK